MSRKLSITRLNSKKLKPLQFSCQIDSLKANNDHTVTLKLDTQELSPDDTALLVSMFQKQLWGAFSELPVRPDDLDIPENAVEFKDDKSPSQRFRNRLWVYFKQKYGGDDGDFKAFYEKTLDKIGQKYLSKLDEE